MKNNLLKRIYFMIFITLFTIMIFSINSYAYDNMFETSEYASVKNVNLMTQETEVVNIPTRDIGVSLESYKLENRRIMKSVREGDFSSRAIMGEFDNRMFISDTTIFPHSAIAFVEVSWPNGDTTNATAFMIASNKALTNAHVIYNAQRGGLATQVKVIPGKNAGLGYDPFNSAYASNVAYPSQYETADRTLPSTVQYEWAVLKLNSNIGNQCGWLDLQAGGLSIGENGDTFCLAGYPIHMSGSSNYIDFQTNILDQRQIGYQYYSTGKITRSTLYYLEHNIDALSGNSGSPIYMFTNDNNIKAVAIYEGDIRTGSEIITNIAKPITSLIINTAAAL